jgi:hypothetical protein
MDDGSAQLRQPPVQAPSQHTPSTHWPDTHSAPPPQGWPMIFLPHWPATQAWPASQSASTLHELVQAPAVHRNGPQGCTFCGRHVPLPSHVPAVLRRVPVHEGAMHWVSAAYSSQPPKPSHVPVCPHEVAPWSLHWPRGSGTPWSTAQHVPMRPGSAHATQPPWQATLQQTLSAQKPEAHSELTEHVAPFIFLPQLLATHCCPATHWLDCEHDS